ncbi:hypothetical protein AMTRI_Chr06g197750 [Amborella trichopoda]
MRYFKEYESIGGRWNKPDSSNRIGWGQISKGTVPNFVCKSDFINSNMKEMVNAYGYNAIWNITWIGEEVVKGSII